MALRGSSDRRFAESVFSIAKEHNSFDGWSDDLEAIRSVFTHPDMRRFLDDPKPSMADKEQVVEKLLGGKVDRLALNLAILLIRREQIGIAAGVEREYQRMVNDHRNVAVARVTTAIELEPQQRQTVKQRLEALTSKTIELEMNVDTSIIGGFEARVGDVLIDATLRTRLANLRQDLLAHT